jgi:hypothetical protein
LIDAMRPSPLPEDGRLAGGARAAHASAVWTARDAPPIIARIVSPSAPAPWLLACLAALPLVLIARSMWTAPLLDTDLWWLMLAGARFVAGEVPRTNLFSWTAPDHPWVCHSLLVGAIYWLAGVDGVGVVRGLVASATALLLLALAHRRQHHWATLLAVAWVMPMVVYGRSERPLAWGNMMMAALMVLLERAEWRHRHAAAALLIWVWAWVHGSFVVGLVALALHSWRWALVGAALTLANPYGLELWKLVAGYGAGADAMAFVHAHVPEWFPARPTHPWIALMLVLAALAGGLALWRRDWRTLALWALLFPLALRHLRFIDIFAIAMLPSVARAFERLPRGRPIASPVVPAALALALVAALAPRVAPDPARFPAALLPAIPADERLWNEWLLGGWLAFHGRAPYWDTRNDPYPRALLEEGLRIQSAAPGWREALAARGVELVVAVSPALQRALEADGWRRVAVDGETAVWRRH